MKKYIKIFFIITITAIISVVGTVIADSIINSNNVIYTGRNNNTTVDVALNNIYSNINTVTGINSIGTVTYESVQGTPQTRRDLTKELTKGKYIIVTNNNEAWADNGAYPETYGLADENTLSCASENCDIRKIGGYHNQPKATTDEPSNHRIMMTDSIVAYYVEIKENVDTLSTYASSAATYTTGAQSLLLYVIPIS